jgi:hypothetical protein
LTGSRKPRRPCNGPRSANWKSRIIWSSVTRVASAPASWIAGLDQSKFSSRADAASATARPRPLGAGFYRQRLDITHRGFGRVAHEMVAVRDRHCRRRTPPSTVRVETGAIPREDLDFGMAAQPGGEALGGTVRSPIDHALAPCPSAWSRNAAGPVVYSQHAHSTRTVAAQAGLHPAQDGIRTAGHPKVL